VVGDNVTIHRDVLLDDRGGIVIGDNVSISDRVHAYSHQHCITDAKVVTLIPTIIEDGARLTYHATILAGTRVGHDSMVGTCGVLTKDTRPHAIHVGIPAKKIKEKREKCEFCQRRHNLECYLDLEAKKQ
ncbi:acyltransferase, partial [Acidobacteriota bacterium]